MLRKHKGGRCRDMETPGYRTPLVMPLEGGQTSWKVWSSEPTHLGGDRNEMRRTKRRVGGQGEPDQTIREKSLGCNPRLWSTTQRVRSLHDVSVKNLMVPCM